jgi:hypothetical protein
MKSKIHPKIAPLILIFIIPLGITNISPIYATDEDNNSLDLELTETQQISPETSPENQRKTEPEDLKISPEILEESPVLRRWLQEIPNVLDDIRHDPSFTTRIKFGYSYFPSTDQRSGFHIGIEDVFLGETGLTISGEYQQTFDGDYRRTLGGDLRYYLFPLGSNINLAPLVGYRYIESNNYTTDGVNLGAKLMITLSRTGAADFSVSQSFVSPTSNDEVGMTTFAFGYALNHNLRLATEMQNQNSREEKDRRFGISLEWMLN